MVLGFLKSKKEKKEEAQPIANTDTASVGVSVAETPVSTDTDGQAEIKQSYFSRLKAGLAKTGAGFSNLFLGKKAIDEDLLEELETALLMADVGIEATQEIIEDITDGISRKSLSDTDAVVAQLKETMQRILSVSDKP